MTTPADPLDVLDFWWRAGPDRWFARNDAFDAEVRSRFLELHERAAAGELHEWQETAPGSLAFIILTDQFPRNMFRNDARAFSTDPLALAAAEKAVGRGFDRAYPLPAKTFFYMPFMHAEDIGAQERGIDLFQLAGDRNALFYALYHMDVIRRFGRFPHRNPVLGRTTSEAEQRYLDSGGFGGA